MKRRSFLANLAIAAAILFAEPLTFRKPKAEWQIDDRISYYIDMPMLIDPDILV